MYACPFVQSRHSTFTYFSLSYEPLKCRKSHRRTIALPPAEYASPHILDAPLFEGKFARVYLGFPEFRESAALSMSWSPPYPLSR